MQFKMLRVTYLVSIKDRKKQLKVILVGVNVCVSVDASMQLISRFPKSFSALVYRCSSNVIGIVLCAQVRMHERRCACTCNSYLGGVGFVFKIFPIPTKSVQQISSD